MDLQSKRTQYRADGIFSAVSCKDGPFKMVTLEHAYPTPSDGWVPKIPPGTYTCVRGKHRLHGMTEDFETFEITGVEGHSNLLFHWGNWNDNSEGCMLTGEAEIEGVHNGLHVEMVTNSRATFARFMELQAGVDTFQLTVEA